MMCLSSLSANNIGPLELVPIFVLISGKEIAHRSPQVT